MTPSHPVEVRINSRWWGTKIQKEVAVARARERVRHGVGSGSSLKDFQPMTEPKKNGG